MFFLLYACHESLKQPHFRSLQGSQSYWLPYLLFLFNIGREKFNLQIVCLGGMITNLISFFFIERKKILPVFKNKQKW